LERLQRRTGFNRQTFLNYVTDQIAYDFRLDVRLPKADRTLPKLIAFYKSQIGAEKLEAAALKVAEKYSQVHG
jgi:hypothetical protein